MKLFRIISLVMALALLAGCSAGPASTGSQSGGKDTVSPTTPTTLPETQPTTQEPVVAVDCLLSIVSRYEDEEYTGTIRYEADGIHIVPDVLVDDYHTILSPEGLVLCDMRYNAEGVHDHRLEYSYNSDGQVTEFRYYYVDEGRLNHHTIYEYDAAGHLLTEYTYYGDDGSIRSGWEYSYDENGNRILSSFTDMEGINTWRYTYTYDENGRILTAAKFFPYDADGEHDQLGYYTYSYDAAGRLVSKLWTETKGTYFVNHDYYYSYNEAGLLTQSKAVDDRGDVEELMTYTYDNQNRLTSVVDELYGYNVTFVYGQIELPASLAEAAKVWSESGLINYYVIKPN